jgi:mannosyl-3-phosphoglycerate phosphatase
VSLVVVSDLDGCLLDEESYSYEAARPALDALRRAGVPLVLCSSKTRAEMEPLHRELGLSHPYVVENGGALVVPRGAPGLRPSEAGRGGFVTAFGTARPALVSALTKIAAETGVRLRGFASLSAEDVAGLTGLALEQARLAREREYDEPFLLDGGEAGLAAVREAAERCGLTVTRGGRFFHLLGAGSDKGRAARRVLELYAGHPVSAALGDSANDLPLLRVVDRPILVPRPSGELDADLRRALPAAARAPAPGPVGWNQAVLGLLNAHAAAAEARSLP